MNLVITLAATNVAGRFNTLKKIANTTDQHTKAGAPYKDTALPASTVDGYTGVFLKQGVSSKRLRGYLFVKYVP